MSLDETLRSDSAPAENAASPPFPLASDRYQPVRFLGEGGVGRVFLAWDARLQRRVALKFLRDVDPAAARRFVAEARAQARVEDERVCKVFEVGESDGRVYIAMQLVDGQTPAALDPQPSLEEKVALVREVALGVQAAHTVGLIHRDLKPGNILVERKDDGRLAPYVMDFGLARDATATATTTGALAGTPHYMSPEQARGEGARLDRRTDVYSLGATLYALVLGRPPFPGGSTLEILARVASDDPPRPRAIDRSVPADLEAILLKCLEKEPSGRYDSARALADDLGRFLAGEPVRARRAGALYRLRRWVRRRRGLVALSAAALAVAGVLVGQAALARRDLERRERAARRFTELVERVEAMARFSELAPLHDTREDRQAIRARMDALGAEIRDAGPAAAGPARYALGRGAGALGDEAEAARQLEAAWALGYREPEVAYGLALSWGRRYQERLREVEAIAAPGERERRRRDAEQRFRDPALAYLQRSEGAAVPSAAYVAALLAFYEGRLDDALARVQAIRLPWFYEAPRLRGDVLVARALARWNRGERDEARADFEAGRRAYADAAAIGRSVPSLHRALAELEVLSMSLESYGGGEVEARHAAGRAALERALATAAEVYEAQILGARLDRRLAEYRIDRGEPAGELLARAVAAAEAARRLAPERSEARLVLAMAYWQMGRERQEKNQDPGEPFGRALALLDDLAAADTSGEVDFQRAVVWKVWGEYDEQVGVDPIAHWTRAVERFRASLGRDERQVEAWINLGITLYQRTVHPRAPDPAGDLAAARAAIERAQGEQPEHVVACYYAGLIGEEVAARARRAGADPRPELSRALATYRRCIGWGPRLVHLRDAAGGVLLSLAREAWDRGSDPTPLLEEARGELRAGAALAPEHGIAHHNLGVSYVDAAWYARAAGGDPRAQVRDAAAALATATRMLAEHAPPWADLGTANVLQADWELARGTDPAASLARGEAALLRARERNPDEAQAWLYLGEARAIEARWAARRGADRPEDWEAAEALYRKALALAPERDEYTVAAGRSLRDRADSERARRRDPRPVLARGLALVEPVLARRPAWADARALRGALLLALAEAGGRAGDAGGDETRALARRAVADLRAAADANRNLTPVLREPLRQAEQLGGPI